MISFYHRKLFIILILQTLLHRLESYLKLFYLANHKALSDINLFCNEIIKCMTMLVPLYNIMVWRTKVNIHDYSPINDIVELVNNIVSRLLQ